MLRKIQEGHREGVEAQRHVRSERVVLFAGFGVVFCALWFFGWLAEEVGEGDTVRFDSAVRAAVYAHATVPLTRFMKFVTLLGSGPAITTLAVLALVVFYRMGLSHYAKLLAATLGGALALELSLKLAFHRPRPVPFFDIVPPASYSFPSGHALGSFCFFSAWAIIASDGIRDQGVRIVVWVGAMLLSLLIGFSRIYLGVHYPSDVVAGYAVGIGWMTAVYVVHKIHRDNIRREQSRSPR